MQTRTGNRNQPVVILPPNEYRHPLEFFSRFAPDARLLDHSAVHALRLLSADLPDL